MLNFLTGELTMKTRKMPKTLMVKKSTIANLQNSEMVTVKGGIATEGVNCITKVVTCNSSTCYETALLYTCTSSVVVSFYPRCF